MRKQNSLFNHACEFVNSVPVGERFRTADYIRTVGQYEEWTRWKSRSNEFYTTHSYKTLLKRAGFISNPKRGEWKVIKHIPTWFDGGHLKFILNGMYDYKTGKRIETYKGMTAEQIRARLNETAEPVKTAVAGSAVPFGGTTVNHITKEIDQSLRETYPANVENSFEFRVHSHPGTISPAALMTENESDFRLNGSVGCVVEKITKEESMFAEQPKREVATDEIVNLGLLRSAIASVDMITTSDSVLHGRILNALSILTDIEKSMSAKIDAQLFKGKL